MFRVNLGQRFVGKKFISQFLLVNKTLYANEYITIYSIIGWNINKLYLAKLRNNRSHKSFEFTYIKFNSDISTEHR